MEHMNTVESVQRAIESLTDGPLTPFVIINRACLVLARGKSDVTTVANAIYESLSSRGWVSDSELTSETVGS